VRKGRLNHNLTVAGSDVRRELDEKIHSIGFWDNGSEADEKIGFLQICAKYQERANSALKEREGVLKDLVSRLQKTPYTLPVFDPLGNQAGESVSVKAVVALKQMSIALKSLHVQLSSSILDALGEVLSTVIDWFSTEDEKRRRREQRRIKLENIYRQIHTQCDPRLEELIRDGERTIREEIRKGVKSIEEAIERVEQRLTSVEREPLSQTKRRLEEMLVERAMKPALAANCVAAFHSLALKHQYEKSLRGRDPVYTAVPSNPQRLK
jgi:hypothetical protein